MSRLLFTKEGVAVWSSHLDLMRALMRSFRRAGIDLKHSQGFTPHPELSILMPLSVGVESQCELAEFALAEGCEVPAAEIAPRLDPVLPAGLRAVESYDGGQKAGKLAWLRARLTLTYEATGNGQQATGDGGTDSSTPLCSAQKDRIEALSSLFARPSLIVEKHGKKGPVELDVAPMIREVTVGAVIGRPPETTGKAFPLGGRCSSAHTGADEGLSDERPSDVGTGVVLEAVVAAQNPTLNPLLLATAIETWLPAYKPDHVACRRLEIYDAEMRVFR